MWTRRVIVPALLTCFALGQPLQARADGQPPKVIEIAGTYAFDWYRGTRSRCAKVSGALLRKLKKGYTCTPPDAGSASGRPVLAQCTKGERSQYLLFATAADCKEERETQLANGA
ncbi:MAG: hypothetical protein IPI49_30615 [Myxococcales bacterium]|nr:hypothetical protein [Myxococcales bacterium]HRC58656.1 hypothetical protein [Kofleriaceae bacterium]